MESSSAPWRVLETIEPEQPDTARTAAPESATLPRGMPWLAIGAGLVALAMATVALLASMGPAPIIGVDGADIISAEATGEAVKSPPPAADTDQLVVDVGGAVARPGVYRLPAGARIGDAITAAGGYGASVDAALVDRQLNLAEIVRDGAKIRVPMRGDASVAASGEGSGPGSGVGVGGSGTSAGSSAGSTGLINLNHASATELDTLPGVGPVTAGKIIAAREETPYTSVDDLLTRKVVGSAALEKLRGLVTVGP